MDNSRTTSLLIVDDNPQNLQVLGKILQETGYKVSIAMNGVQALDYVQKKLPDLILLDMMMPEMDGLETCEHLKKDASTRDIPVIFITALVDTENIVNGLEAGAVDYITKPFNETELLARVKTHLALKKAQQDLKEANATKDTFFSIIAHDLKNPFGALITLSDVLVKDYDFLDDEKRKELIQIISDSSDNIYKLLENLLNWSRMQTGGIEWRPENIDLHKLADDNVSLLKTAAENKNITLASDFDTDTAVFADVEMITMVFRNLITNAVKFTPKGGEIRITSKTLGNLEEIAISDTGVGISEDDIKKLFRVDEKHSTRGTEREKGTGLGLILCKEFIEKNGGEIRVESEPGKGSTFKFTLPEANKALMSQ